MKFKFIEDNCSSFPVRKMYQVLCVSSSGYYRWKKVPISNQKAENKKLKERIKELYSRHKCMIGSPMLTADLREDSEFSGVSRTRVARYMKEMRLKCRAVKKFVVTTDSKHNEPVALNLLDRQFTVPAPDIVYVTDITYLKVGRKWQVLTVFIDLFSRLVVGWALCESLERHSSIRALNKAILRRRGGQSSGLMIHSDRGVQYASSDFRAVLQKHGFIQSMSRKGNCWDTQLQSHFFIQSKLKLSAANREWFKADHLKMPLIFFKRNEKAVILLPFASFFFYVIEFASLGWT